MTVATIPPQFCRQCKKDSGTKIICDACLPELTKSQIQNFDRQYQLRIIELFSNACVDCGHSAETESGELCADHLQTKGSDPLSRYDLASGVCRCADCHRKRHNGERKVVPEKEKLPKQTQLKQERFKKPAVCKAAGCPAWSGYSDGMCWKHSKHVK